MVSEEAGGGVMEISARFRGPQVRVSSHGAAHFAEILQTFTIQLLENSRFCAFPPHHLRDGSTM